MASVKKVHRSVFDDRQNMDELLFFSSAELKNDFFVYLWSNMTVVLMVVVRRKIRSLIRKNQTSIYKRKDD